MKKIVLFMLLLLNLHVTIDIDKGSLNFECGKIMAQNWLEETLPDVVVTASQYTTCSMCYMTVEKKNLQMHLDLDCPKRTVECGFCHKSYVYCDGHTCNVEGYCLVCHKSIDECTCEGAVCTGNGHTETTIEGGGVEIVSNGGVGSPSGETGQFSNESGKIISIGDLKYKPGVKLVSYITLPDKLHPQIRKMECVLRAYAFMAEMKGYDYDKVFEALGKIAKELGLKLESDGIPSGELINFFKDYCQIGTGYNEPSIVASYIDRGIPVAAVTCSTPYHMVTIIGYDSNYYYTAAGDSSGNATIYSKDQLSCFDYFYFYNTTNIPFQ